MKPFTVVEGYAAPIMQDNIDTDVIVSTGRIAKLKRGQFAPWAFEAIRYLPDGSEDANFILNREPFRKAQILIAGANFGCGSSREMAVWSIEEFGIRCIVAQSYGDIFYGNCLQNGVLPIRLERDQIDALARVAVTGASVTVDLQACKIFTAATGPIEFAISDTQREALLSGLDEVAQTLNMAASIDQFQQEDRRVRPWVYAAVDAAMKTPEVAHPRTCNLSSRNRMSEDVGKANAAGDLLRELPEAEVSGNAREIYAEIKSLCGVPMVALIYRHLVTIPGALEWAWALLRPVMAAGLVQERAWELAGRADIPPTPSIPRAALRVAGIMATDETTIAAVLDAYGRANPVNLLAVRCLALHLHGLAANATNCPDVRHWYAPRMLAPLPAMINPQDMDPAVRELVLLLTDRGESKASGIWPSLYRHLARWPNMLGFAAVIVTHEFPAIDAAAGRLREEVVLAAAELASLMVPPPNIEPPIAVHRDQLLSAIDSFTLHIPEMIVIGALLRRAMPDRAVGFSNTAPGCLAWDGHA